MFPSVNVINVPAVLDKNGHLRCATTSTYRAKCSGHSTALQITGINSNAESYFFTGHKPGSAVKSSKFDMVHGSFSTPFVYAPHHDQFPSEIVNENFGYVPQTLVEWIARHPDYVSEFPGIASCLPGGPSIGFNVRDICSRPPSHDSGRIRLGFQPPASTISSTITIARRGCFHPGACPTSASPGATPVATTPLVTPEAHFPNSMLTLCCLQQGYYMMLTTFCSTFDH